MKKTLHFCLLFLVWIATSRITFLNEVITEFGHQCRCGGVCDVDNPEIGPAGYPSPHGFVICEFGYSIVNPASSTGTLAPLNRARIMEFQFYSV